MGCDHKDKRLLVETKEGAALSEEAPLKKPIRPVGARVSHYLVREYAIDYHLLHAEAR
jgi:hypothetical protein